jgi:hypothetical protein
MTDPWGADRLQLFGLAQACPGRHSCAEEVAIRWIKDEPHVRGRNAMPNEAQLRNAADISTDGIAGVSSEAWRTSRRSLLLGGSVASLGAAAGLGLPLGGGNAGLTSAAVAQSAPAAPAPSRPQSFDYPGKDKRLVLLGDRPLVAETPESLLDDDTTPVGKFFVRNNGQIPDEAKQADTWTIRVEGEVERFGGDRRGGTLEEFLEVQHDIRGGVRGLHDAVGGLFDGVERAVATGQGGATPFSSVCVLGRHPTS